MNIIPREIDSSKTYSNSMRVVVVSFLVDFSDVVLSLFVAVLSGSVIMLTQFLEGLADLISSGALLVGLVRSERVEDRDHPFGYGKEIYFWTLISALIMFGITATLSVYFGWERFLHPREIVDLWLVFAVLLLGLFTNLYSLSLSWRRLSKNRSLVHIIQIFYKSSLIETKTTFILDFMGTYASLFGIIALVIYWTTGDYRFDGLGAMVIGVILAFFAYLLIMNIRDLMIGKSAPVEVEQKIKEAALGFSEVEEVMAIKTLYVGSEKLLVNLDVHMKSSLTAKDVEKLVEKIKARMKEVLPVVKYLQVELETAR